MLTLAFGFLIGLVLGLLGAGGSILTVPVFTYVAGFDPKVAIAASLPVVAVISAFGALGHWRAGNVQLRTATLFGAFAMLGSFAGARSAQWLSGRTQLLLFAAVLLMAAASMLRRAPAAAAGPDAAPLPLARLAPLGLLLGALTGLVGVGGGFLIVPVLAQIARLPMRAAIGTSLVVIAMNATAGTLGYLGQVSLPFGLLVPFTVIALIGTIVGTGAAQRVPQATLRRAFALLLVVIATFILYQHLYQHRAPDALPPATPEQDAPDASDDDTSPVLARLSPDSLSPEP